MRPNKYKYVSLAAMIAVMLLLGLYMWMTYRSAVRDISERAGNQLPWAMFYESYNRAEILSKGDTLSLPQLRGDLSLVSSVEGMNDVLSRKYHSEISLDTLSVFVDSLLSVVNLNRDFTILEVDHQGSILRRSNNQETSSSLKTRVFSIRRDQSKGIQLALNNPYPELAPLLDKIEEQKLTIQEEAAAREEMRREFSANVSHELKTPLTSISGFAELMSQGIVSGDKVTEFSKDIYKESQRMISLIDDIIKLSKLDENAVGPKRDAVDLKKLAMDVAEKLKPAGEARAISIETRGESAKITGAYTLLYEMLYNLCENAVTARSCA